MSAQLFFSNSPAVLLDRLSDNLDWSDPFRSPRIATPTPAMKRWVQLRLAEKRGIVANVEFLQLERALWDRLGELDRYRKAVDRKPARLLDEQALQLLILAHLRRSPPPEAATYLDAQGDTLYAPRLCQLARKLAGFFREYEYSRVREHGREGLAALWMRGEDCFQAFLAGRPAEERRRWAGLEAWQRGIYHSLFRLGGLRDALGESTGQYRYTLPQYAEMVLAQERRPAAPGEEAPAYHLFGLSQISPFHRSLIQRLADAEDLSGRHARFHIYSLNPCAEYWEDVLTPGERLRQQGNLFQRDKYQGWRDLGPEEKAKLRLPEEVITAEELHLEENENPLLSRWGKPGRENIQLWCQITGYDFSECFQESGARGLLATARNGVLHRRGVLPVSERALQDDSLRILACPEIHREAETVLQDILGELLRDPDLRPDDIAVVAPDMEKYRYVLASVFGRSGEGEAGYLPFTLADASAASASDYARAVRQLFELALGRFSRKEMFALAENPCFRPGAEAGEAGLHAWKAWTARLNVFHAYDGGDKRERGYADDPLHTWAHGLERLALGAVMESPAEDDERDFGGIVPFADGNTGDRDSLAAFLSMVRGLHRDLAPLRAEAARPWSEWLACCEALLDRYLFAPDEDPVEGYVRAELRRYLAELRGLDVIEALAAGGEAPGTHFRIPLDLILARLEALQAGREPHLSGGVNVAGLGALRSLPFKILYVVGLGEGEFPDPDPASTLDLRRSRRVIGDVDPTARNRYLFLEALLCAEKKVRLSWVSRDPQQGKTLQMCSTLHELSEYLESCVLAPDAEGKPVRFRITEVPYASRDPALFPAPGAPPPLPWDPPANPFRSDRLLSWLSEGAAAHPGFAARLAATPGPAREILPSPLPGPRAEPAVTAVSLDDFRLFLENPARYRLRRGLGIRDAREEDPMDEEDEPFTCPDRADWDLLKRVAHRRMAAPDGGSRTACRAWFDAAYANLGLRGLMPAGPYREWDREHVWAKAGLALDCLDEVSARMAEGGAGWERTAGIVLGDGLRQGMVPRMRDLSPLRLPPVKLMAAGRALELHGELPNFFRERGGGRSASVVFSPYGHKTRYLLPGFLFHAAAQLVNASAGEWLREGGFTLYHVGYDTAKRKFGHGNWAPFQPWPGQAELWLRSVAEAMLGGTEFDALPFDMIERHLAPDGRLKDGPDYAQTLREAVEESDEDGDRGGFPPPESEILLDARVPADAEAKIRSRLGPFFNFAAPEDHGR